MDKRVLNEFDAKIINEERMDHVVALRSGSRTAEHSEMLFSCECADSACSKKISMSTEEYKHVHNKTKYFIVFPGHEQPDIEKVVEKFNGYSLVSKFLPEEH